MSVSNAFVTVVSFAEMVDNPFSSGLRDTVRAGGPLQAACHVQLDSCLSLHAPLGHDLNKLCFCRPNAELAKPRGLVQNEKLRAISFLVPGAT